MNPRKFKPETLMMSYGYNPHWSEGAMKCPIFQTSSFVFNSAEEGKAHFELAYELRDKKENEVPGLIYSRINNPDLEILENRLKLWDEAEDCAVFESGMSAISSCLLEFLKPGELLLYSNPVYGGTDHFITHFLKKMGIETLSFDAREEYDEIVHRIIDSGMSHKLAAIYIETPANPTNDLFDLQMCRGIANHFSTGEKNVTLLVDNTYMGPIWQHPLKHGADLVIYSATKYLGGHSDIIAGAVVGSQSLIHRIKVLRTFLGNMAGPWTGWLLMRSLETLQIRMEKQLANAMEISAWLRSQSLVEKIYYPGMLPKGSRAETIFKKQCLAPGAMLSFDIKGGEKVAFAFLNSLKLFKMAVSLGSTESLAQHPSTMTHAGVDPATKRRLGVTDKMVRLSFGVENVHDLIWDLEQAFSRAVQMNPIQSKITESLN